MTAFIAPMLGFLVDGILFETVDGMSILNRAPQPAETQVPVASMVDFDLATTSGTVTLASTQVWIDSVLVFDGGTFSAGYDGPASTYGNPQADVLRIRIDPTTDFAPLTTKTIRVVSASSAGGSIDVSWIFVVEDVIAPEVVAALATNPTTVRVTFDEPVRQVSSSGASDALNPSNWTTAIESTSLDDGLPAVGITVVSVSSVSDSIVDLALNWEMTPGAIYRVSVSSVVDAFGNVVNPGANSATFGGFVLPKPYGRRFSLWECLPQANRSEDITRDLETFVACLQEPLDHLLYSIDKWIEILDPDYAPERFIDAMLADLGNPFGFEFELNDKRKLVQLLVPIFKKKGTAGGIIDSVRLLLGLEVTIEVPAFSSIFTLDWSYIGEDYLGSGASANLYTFFVVSPVSLTQEQRDRITSIAEYMKAAHEHLGGITEPAIPITPDHLELGLSSLGVDWLLH